MTTIDKALNDKKMLNKLILIQRHNEGLQDLIKVPSSKKMKAASHSSIKSPPEIQESISTKPYSSNDIGKMSNLLKAKQVSS
jgi:3-deoxy-D-manno-octulosonic-acid transferase